jgi:ABC-type Fe3+/spermidine/putrescine transport system ATPase subunit/nucleotide-binding universal stress UspA family protein
MSILLQNISKSYGGRQVVEQFTLEVLDGELFVLLGASGSGKTTVLRIIAGLVSPDRGEVHLKGKVVNSVPPQQRNIGLVFQNYSLFRHMSVAENIGFGLRLRRVPPKARREKVDQLLEMIGLPGFGERMPSELSGGQQQRVAVARALAYEPEVLLLDEPFGALDLKTRSQLRHSLKAIQRKLGVTTVLVTHDQGDAFELGDRIGVMEKGRLLSIGTPTEVYRRPKSHYVAQFLGEANFFTGLIEERHVRIGTATLPLSREAILPERGTRVQVLIRPEQLEVAPTQSALEGNFLGEGTVEELLFAGSSYRLKIRVPGLVRFSSGGVGDGDPTLLSVQIGLEAEQTLSLEKGGKAAVGVLSFHILPYQGLRMLVGIDGSEHGGYALQLAAYLAKKTLGSLIIMGIAERFSEKVKAKEGLTQAGKALGVEIQEVETIFRQGHPAEEILNEIERSRYDLVVLGKRGRHAPARFLGSTAARVAIYASAPTLLTPTPVRDFQNILVCVSGEKISRSDIRFIGRIARNTGARVTLYHVDAERDDPMVLAYLQEVFQLLKSLGIPVGIKTEKGEVIESILKEADEGAHDLLVLGTRMGVREAFMTQSVTSQILSKIDRPVLVLHIRIPE